MSSLFSSFLPACTRSLLSFLLMLILPPRIEALKWWEGDEEREGERENEQEGGRLAYVSEVAA